jgi:hypothetical protein
MLARIVRGFFRLIAVRSLAPARWFDPLLPISTVESFDPDNPYVRRLIGAPGARTKSVRWAKLFGCAILPILGGWWIIESLPRLQGPNVVSGGSQAALAASCCLILMAMALGPLAGWRARWRLETDPILPELLLATASNRAPLAGLHGLVLIWTGATARATWLLVAFLLSLIWSEVEIRSSRYGVLPPSIHWGMALSTLFVASFGAANWVAGFYLRTSQAALPTETPHGELLLTFFGFCARWAFYLSFLGGGDCISGPSEPAAFCLFLVVMEGAIAASRISRAQTLWKTAESGINEALRQAIAPEEK